MALCKRLALIPARSALSFTKTKFRGLSSSHCHQGSIRAYCSKPSVKNEVHDFGRLSEMRQQAFDDILENFNLPEAQKKVIAEAKASIMKSETKYAQIRPLTWNRAGLEDNLREVGKKFEDNIEQIISSRKRFIAWGVPTVFTMSVTLTVLFSLEYEKLEARRAQNLNPNGNGVLPEQAKTS